MTAQNVLGYGRAHPKIPCPVKKAYIFSQHHTEDQNNTRITAHRSVASCTAAGKGSMA